VKLEVLHGPNLNLLGSREPEVYGRAGLEDVNDAIRGLADELGVTIGIFQSNHEGELIDRIHAVAGEVDGFVVNAGGFTHTSVALRDALQGVGRPFVEAHLSNVHAREPFRRESLLAPVAVGSVVGFGTDSYLLAVRGLVRHLKQ